MLMPLSVFKGLVLCYRIKDSRQMVSEETDMLSLNTHVDHTGDMKMGTHWGNEALEHWKV